MIQSSAQGRTVLETIVDLIVARFDPRRIVLFGSHARGDARADSDYDLMVELASVENEWKMSWEIKEALPRGIADDDALAVEQLSSHERVAWPIVCFHAQQAAEKYLKAVLVWHRIPPARTHDLTLLLSRVRAAGTGLEGLDADCALLSTYPVEFRYPSREPKPTAEDGRAAVDAMRRIVAASRRAIETAL